MNDHCAQCVALWRDYAAITHTHFALQSKLELAGLDHDHDHETLARLLGEAGAAAERRGELRQQIEHHEHEAHPNANASVASQEAIIFLLKAYEKCRDSLLEALAEVERCLDSPLELEAAVPKVDNAKAACEEAELKLAEALTSEQNGNQRADGG